MDQKRILAVMAERLYEDIKFVCQNNPTQVVDDDGVVSFNKLLERTRRTFGYVENVADFSDWSPRTIKYKDALLVAGQLAALVKSVAEGQRDYSGMIAAATSRPEPPPVPAAAPPPAPMPVAPPPSPAQARATRGENITPAPRVGPPPSRAGNDSLDDSSEMDSVSGFSSSRAVRPAPPPAPAPAPAPAQGPPTSAPPRPAPRPRSSHPHDEELYGNAPPPRRNDDGTIPFSLE